MIRVEAHILCFNEAEIIRFTLDHYRKFCDKITIYDNFSTDDSAAIARSMGAHVQPFGKPGVLSDTDYLEIKNKCWKGSDADFVIVCDMDEILDTNRHSATWARVKKETIFRTHGWEVYSNDFPKKAFSEITTGRPCEAYSKLVMFNPRAIQEMNYRPGAHHCNPVGDIRYSADHEPTLFHYKNIGGVGRLLARNKLLASRMSKENRKKGWGKHYTFTEKQVRRDFENVLKIAKPYQYETTRG